MTTKKLTNSQKIDILKAVLRIVPDVLYFIIAMIK